MHVGIFGTGLTDSSEKFLKKILDEKSENGTQFLSGVCFDWENEAISATKLGIDVSIVNNRRVPKEAIDARTKNFNWMDLNKGLFEAFKDGSDSAVLCTPDGYLSEGPGFNIWIVKDGIAITPIPNGSFLNGITRQRLIALMRTDGITVIERTIKPEELETADEIFSTGNYGKVQPVNRYENRKIQPGNIYKRTRELYWAFAHS